MKLHTHPIRTTDLNTGKPLKYPIYAICNLIAEDSFKKLRLQRDESCIYFVEARNTKDELLGVVVGESSQTIPYQRLSTGYKDRIQTLKAETAKTVEALRHLAHAADDRTINLHVGFLNVCKWEDRLEQEKECISWCREMGLPVLNRT